MYLFNTELWGWESWTRDLRYGMRDSVNRRVVDPPRYLWPLSIADHRMRSGGLRMPESTSGADPVGTLHKARVVGFQVHYPAFAVSLLCYPKLDWTTSHLHSELVARIPNAKEMLPSPNQSILPHSHIPFISILVTKKCGSARTARRLVMVRCNLRAFAPWGYLTPSMSWSLPTSIMGFCRTVNIAAV